MIEIWKDVPGYDGDYKVSDNGRILSLKGGKERYLRIKKGTGGYMYVWLSKDGFVKAHRLHRIVASAFITNENNNPEVNHIDENRGNNAASNLEWVTSKYNCNYGNRSDKIRAAKNKAVRQVDKVTLETIAIYISSKEAMKITGINECHINDCCRGRRFTTGGYIWERV